MRKLYLIVIATAMFCFLDSAVSQNSPLPVAGGTPISSLSTDAKSELGDPFFDLVLKADPSVDSLERIEDLIQPNSNLRSTFVVSEDIVDPVRGQFRRSVLSFQGTRGGHTLDNNVMLSMPFNSEEFADRPGRIESLGWDSERGRYNYYLFAGGQWRFSGDSRRAAAMTPTQRNGTCMACHINGAPIMKELLIPWNNWRSFETDGPTSYLSRNSPIAWPVASNHHLAENLRGAESLEGMIIGSTQRFIKGQVNKHIKRTDSGIPESNNAGEQTILNGKLLLRHLFVTTEVNSISSRVPSGLHPFPRRVDVGPDRDVPIPNSFFLNANLIGGQSIPGFEMTGLEITSSQSFSSFATVSADEYKKLIEDSNVSLGGKRGDAFFAWFGPEPSLIDSVAVDELVRAGILTPEFVAAVLAVDLETPILSAKREELLQLVPEQFLFQPIVAGANPLTSDRHPDALTSEIIDSLESMSGLTDPQSQFLANLKSDDPVARLRDKVNEYATRIRTQLSDAASRPAELRRLHDLLIQRRREVNADENFKHLNESGDRLFPLPR